MDVEANFGDKKGSYKRVRTIATSVFLGLAVVFYSYQNIIGFPLIVVDALKFFGKIVGSAFFNATYKDFAYASRKKGKKLSNKSTAEESPETQILMQPAT